MTPFGDLDTHPPRRPVSPFVVLLLGGAATALIAEWLRFQGTLALAIVPGVLGSLITVAAVARLYRARRRWRRMNAHSADVLAIRPLDTEPRDLLTIREEDGRLAIVRAVARDLSPSPQVIPAGERAADSPRSALGPDRDEAARDGTARDASSRASSRDAADPTERRTSHVDR